MVLHCAQEVVEARLRQRNERLLARMQHARDAFRSLAAVSDSCKGPLHLATMDAAALEHALQTWLQRHGLRCVHAKDDSAFVIIAPDGSGVEAPWKPGAHVAMRLRVPLSTDGQPSCSHSGMASIGLPLSHMPAFDVRAGDCHMRALCNTAAPLALAIASPTQAGRIVAAAQRHTGVDVIASMPLPDALRWLITACESQVADGRAPAAEGEHKAHHPSPLCGRSNIFRPPNGAWRARDDVAGHLETMAICGHGQPLELQTGQKLPVGSSKDTLSRAGLSSCTGTSKLPHSDGESAIAREGSLHGALRSHSGGHGAGCSTKVQDEADSRPGSCTHVLAMTDAAAMGTASVSAVAEAAQVRQALALALAGGSACGERGSSAVRRAGAEAGLLESALRARAADRLVMAALELEASHAR
jgi:hypothetical protein